MERTVIPTVWDRILVGFGYGMIALGLLWAARGASPLFSAYTGLLGQAFGKDGHLDSSQLPLLTFLCGPWGGSVAGQWVLMVAVLRHAFLQRAPWAWTAVFASMGIGFLVQGMVGLMTDAGGALVALPALLFLLPAIPLMVLRPSFASPPSAPSLEANPWQDPARVDGEFSLWARGLFVACVGFAAFGLVSAFMNRSTLFSTWMYLAARTFLDQDRLPEETVRLVAFLFGPIGGSIAATFLLMAALAKGPFMNREPWAHRALTSSLLTWFVVDSAVSLAHGALFNVVLVNVLTLAAIGVPLFKTRAWFR